MAARNLRDELVPYLGSEESERFERVFRDTRSADWTLRRSEFVRAVVAISLAQFETLPASERSALVRESLRRE